MAILELTLVPIGTQTTSLSQYVAKAYDNVRNKENIKIELNPMGTVMQGDIDELLKAVRDMQEAVFTEGVDRVYSVIKIDDRRDKDASFEQKLDSVNRKLK